MNTRKLKTAFVAIVGALALNLATPATAGVSIDDANHFVKMCDSNKDGMLSKTEMMARMSKMLAAMPTDKAGMLDEMRTIALLLEIKRGDGNPPSQMISKEMLMKKIEAAFDKMDADKKSMIDAKRTMEFLAELMRSPG